MANSAAAVKADKPPRKVMKKSVRDTLTAYTFIAPNFIGFCVFTLVPMVFAIALAFCSWDGRHDIEFVAIDNFVRLFTQDRIFQAALVNTIVYVIGTVPLTLVCSLAMAVLLNQNVRLRNFFRTVAFFPYVASLVAVAAVWNMIFNPAMGPINSLLSALGVENLPRWAAGKDTAMLQQFWHITLPQLRPTTFFVVIMLTISGFKVYDQMYMITQGGPGNATMTLVYYIYNVAFVNTPKYGYASAIAMVLFVLVLIVTIVQFRGSRGEN